MDAIVLGIRDDQRRQVQGLIELRRSENLALCHRAPGPDERNSLVLANVHVLVPRFNSALPVVTVICCWLVAGSLRTAARLFSRSEATAFSNETCAEEPGTSHLPVARSTCPEVICTPTSEARSWATRFSSTVTRVSPLTV